MPKSLATPTVLSNSEGCGNFPPCLSTRKWKRCSFSLNGMLLVAATACMQNKYQHLNITYDESYCENL